MIKRILQISLILMCIQAYGQKKRAEIKITGQYMGETVHQILDDISNRYELIFDYKKEDIPDEFRKGQFYTELPLKRVLDKLLGGYDLHYLIQPSGDVIIRKKGEELIKVYQPTRSNFSLKGRLIDRSSGESLPFATLYIKGSTAGTTTNIDGYFTLLNTPTDTSTIVIQYIGYKTRELHLHPSLIKKGEYMEIKLESMITQLEEVVVSDQREHMVKASGKISSFSIAPSQLSSLPSLGEKDIFRGLQMLPGISATNETSSGLYVRGGTPDQNLILFDGFTVYHVDHFYGFFSAFNANAVKDVQFYKGGFEAKYGGRLSSVVSLTGKNGNSNKVSGNVGLSAISVNGSLEVPFAEGDGSIFIAGRRSFTDIIRSGLYNDIFDLFQEENEAQAGQGPGGRGFAQVENEPDFYFYDLNTKITYRPSNKDVVSLSFYNGQDKLDNSNDFNSSQFGGGFGGNGGGNFSFDNNTVDLNDWGNVGMSLKWGRQWNDRLFSNSVISYSKYFTNRDRYSDTDITRADSTFTIRNGTFEDNDVNDFTFRTDLEYLVNTNHSMGFGLQYTYNKVDYNQIQNDTLTILDRKDKGMVSAGYIQDTWKVNNQLTVIPGLRFSHYDVTGKVYVEPRISASYQVTDKLKAKAAWGLYNQFVTRIVREDISQGSRDFWLLANNDLNPVSSSTHYIAGLSYETEGFLFDVEAYHKDMTGLSEYTLRFSNEFRGSTNVDELFYEGTGYSRGLEFLVQKKFGKYTGWIGYTLSETIHDFPGISEDPYPALHDQTHEVKIINSLRLGPWTLSGTWVYATGKPYTSPIGGYEVTLLDGTTNSYVSVGEKNGFRLPDYHRLDLSATYSFDWGPKAKAEVGLSAFNVYDNTNVWYKTFEILDGDMVVTDVNTIGFTPNLFFNLKF